MVRFEFQRVCSGLTVAAMAVLAAACADTGTAGSGTADMGGGRDMMIGGGGTGGNGPVGGVTGGTEGGAGGEPIGGTGPIGGTAGNGDGGQGGGGSQPGECTDGEVRGCNLDGCPDDAARKGNQLCADGAWGPCEASDGCNGRDDDCDDETDEDVDGLGAPCTAGDGACAVDGSMTCGDDGDLVCDAVPGAPTEEVCGDEEDNDCDGTVDNGCAPPECVEDADCDRGYLCDADGVCRPGPDVCLTDDDCAADEICDSDACVPAPDECMNDADCAADEVCESGDCVPGAGCDEDADCPAGQICATGVCDLPPPECEFDVDCAAAEICVAGSCENAPPECDDDFDCDAGFVCVRGGCEPAPPECAIDADCRDGEVCENQACVAAPADCAIDLDCARGQVCDDGECVPGADGCQNDGDCAAGEFCDDGVCAPLAQPCVPDAHEEDDVVGASAALDIPAAVDLNHCDDALDWHRFQASVGVAYDIQTSNLGAAADTLIELYDAAGATLLAQNDDLAPGDLASRIAAWTPPATGDYTLVVRSFADRAGPDHEYTLSIAAACLDDGFEEDDAQGDSTIFAVGAGTEIHRHCDPDWTSFAAVAGTNYIIETGDLVGQTDTILELYDQDGSTVLQTNDDFGGTLGSHIEFVAPANGNYFVRVGSFQDAYGGERGYTLDIRSAAVPQCAVDADCGPGEICEAGACVPDPVRCEPDANEEDDDAASGPALAVGRQFVGLSFCDDALDFSTFEAVGGQTYDLQTFNLSPGADTVVSLFDLDGVTVLAADDDGAGDGLASLIQGFTAPADGTYTVMTRSFGDAFGPDRSYSLGVRETCDDDAFEHDDDAARARPVAVGLLAEAHSHCQDEDWVSFDAVAGTTYVLQTGNLVGDEDTLLRLFDAGGALLAEDDDGGGALASRIQWQAPADGNYALRVGTFAEVYGGDRAYALTVTTAAACAVNGDCPAGQICNGGACEPEPVGCMVDADCDPGFGCEGGQCVEVPRCVPDGNEEDDDTVQAHALQIGTPIALNHCDDGIDTFTFFATAGQTLDFETTQLGGSADTILRVLDVDGSTELATNDDGGDNGLASLISAWVAPADGTYYLVVGSFNGAGVAREYTVVAHEFCTDDAFEQDDTLEQGGDLALAEVQRHAHCADEDWVRFDAEAGQPYRVETANVDGGADTILDLVAPDGTTVLATDDDGAGFPASRIVFTPDQPGTYAVRVRSFGNVYGGARGYDLTLARNEAGCTVDADCGPDRLCQAGLCVEAPPRCVPDGNEEDDAFADARALGIGRAVSLNFCDDGADWLAFDAVAGQIYDFQTFNLEAAGGADTLLELVGPDGVTVIRRDDDGAGDGLASLIAGWAAPDSGRYFLQVLSFGGQIGNNRGYSVGIRSTCADDGFEHDDELADARPFTPGEPAQARKLCQDQDWVTFGARAGFGYRIETTNLVAGTDTVIRITDGAGAELAVDDDSNGNLASRIDWTAPSDGAFFVEIVTFGAVYGGDRGYDLLITEVDAADVCADDAGCARGEICVSGQCVLAPGACRADADCPAGLVCVDAACQAVVRCQPDANEEDDQEADAKVLNVGREAALNFCDDATDWLSVDLAAGVTYDLYSEGLEGATDTVLVLFDAAGDEVARDDDGGGGRRSLIDGFAPAAAGTYLLAVQSYAGISGNEQSYRVGVVEHCDEDVYEDDDDAVMAHAFQVNGPAERHAHCRDADWISLDVLAGQTYTLVTTVEGGADTVITLVDADGAELATDDDSGVGLGSQLVHTPVAAGTVFLRVVEFSVYGGARAYALDVRSGCQNDADCAAGETCQAGVCEAIEACVVDGFEQDDASATPFQQFRLNTVTEHNFCDDGADWTAIELVAGQSYDFETMALSDGTDTVIEVFTADAQVRLDADDDGAGIGLASLVAGFVPDADGTYLVLTRSFDNAAGATRSYRLGLREHCVDDALENDDTAEAAVLVAVNAAPVAHALCADEDFIAFEAEAGVTYRIETSALQGGADTLITLFDVDGTTALASNDDAVGLASRLDFQAPAAGTYFIRTAGFADIYGGPRTYSIAVTRQ